MTGDPPSDIAGAQATVACPSPATTSGTIVGALVMQALASTLRFHKFSDAISQMVTAVIIILAVFVQRKRARS